MKRKGFVMKNLICWFVVTACFVTSGDCFGQVVEQEPLVIHYPSGHTRVSNLVGQPVMEKDCRVDTIQVSIWERSPKESKLVCRWIEKEVYPRCKNLFGNCLFDGFGYPLYSAFPSQTKVIEILKGEAESIPEFEDAPPVPPTSKPKTLKELEKDSQDEPLLVPPPVSFDASELTTIRS